MSRNLKTNVINKVYSLQASDFLHMILKCIGLGFAIDAHVIRVFLEILYSFFYFFTGYCKNKVMGSEREEREKKIAFQRDFQKIIAHRNHNKITFNKNLC